MEQIFKAYDIRGVYPGEINYDVAYKIGKAVATYFKSGKIGVGRDMRLSSEELRDGLIKGINDMGMDVLDIGLCSTDMVYFATGKFKLVAGVMITASHNPGKWNGMKICRENARPVGQDSGLFEIRDLAKKNDFINSSTKGIVEKKDIMQDWIQFALSLVDKSNINKFNIAVDAGNGMAGLVIPELEKTLPQIEVFPMFFELDGNFPNHLASPIKPENTEEIRKVVREKQFDLGLAFDGDADRIFLIDDEGEIVSGTIMTAIVAQSMLRKYPKQTILYNAICGKIVPETINKNGGTAIKVRVGHSFVKEVMQKESAIFAGEHSGHYYFRENFNADSALIATLVVLELLSISGLKLSEIRKQYSKYLASGEINTRVDNIDQKLKELRTIYKNADSIDLLDGLSFYFKNFWFNVRPSNTEPLLRLNVEADSKELLEDKTGEILGHIRK